jgi:hypothetical protein
LCFIYVFSIFILSYFPLAFKLTVWWFGGTLWCKFGTHTIFFHSLSIHFYLSNSYCEVFEVLGWIFDSFLYIASKKIVLPNHWPQIPWNMSSFYIRIKIVVQKRSFKKIWKSKQTFTFLFFKSIFIPSFFTLNNTSPSRSKGFRLSISRDPQKNPQKTTCLLTLFGQKFENHNHESIERERGRRRSRKPQFFRCIPFLTLFWMWYEICTLTHQ